MNADSMQTIALPAARRSDLKLALTLTWVTIAWMVIEGVVAVALGAASHSLLLEAFGVDSGLELISAVVLLWRLKVEMAGSADEERIGTVERKAASR